MRRSYIDLPRRLPSARSLARSRSRALPFMLALPLVGVLWVTIAMPILGDVTTASVTDRRARDAFLRGFGPDAPHSHAGQGVAGDSVSFTAFTPAVLRAAGLSAPARLVADVDHPRPSVSSPADQPVKAAPARPAPVPELISYPTAPPPPPPPAAHTPPPPPAPRPLTRLRRPRRPAPRRLRLLPL